MIILKQRTRNCHEYYNNYKLYIQESYNLKTRILLRIKMSKMTIKEEILETSLKCYALLSI